MFEAKFTYGYMQNVYFKSIRQSLELIFLALANSFHIIFNPVWNQLDEHNYTYPST